MSAILPSRLFIVVLCLASFFAASSLTMDVSAKPAAWYLWKSKVDDFVICRQSSAGEGWIRIGGPYKNSRCGR
ncbi:hypothetical protein [Motiliproteus sp. MSK22-1]|uniref:hypothetical protein n=1 Tax=Motiliproteus sp. MSK22-1 TaxID=1897630 RepID=UPI0009764F83|nr:hypothetical protein [Motiliproteus sp. MSK22-1]OMH33576.1 hypothetical protein BGP75_11135 [Motiliproteus sp. MSK22-1]